jgi:predicted Zn-dependent peptidase
MYTLSHLPSKLRVLTAPVDGTASVTVMVFAGAGSRYESRGQRGISHFLEHMFFKGGKKFKTTQEVSAAIDGVGGDFNAFTGKEYAGYYVKVSSEHVELACDVLSDMLLHASFPPEEIDKERGVIMEEERMYQDTPMYRAGWDFEELVFGDHPLGWDTIGTEDVIRSVTQADFKRHKDELYVPGNAVLTFAGKITEAKAMALSNTFFAPLSGNGTRAYEPLKDFGKDKVWLRTKNTEQAHLVMGVPAISAEDPDHFALKLLAIILGGNMSSRMFLRIREARGLCYYISTDTDNYSDAGAISTRAGVDQTRLDEALEAIRAEYLLCARDGVMPDELARAKDYLKGKIVLSLEDSEERAHYFGKQMLLRGKVRDLDDYFGEVAKVTKEQVDALAKRLFTPDRLRLVVIGKDDRKAHFEKMLVG